MLREIKYSDIVFRTVRFHRTRQNHTLSTSTYPSGYVRTKKQLAKKKLRFQPETETCGRGLNLSRERLWTFFPTHIKTVEDSVFAKFLPQVFFNESGKFVPHTQSFSNHDQPADSFQNCFVRMNKWSYARKSAGAPLS